MSIHNHKKYRFENFTFQSSEMTSKEIVRRNSTDSIKFKRISMKENHVVLTIS